MQMYRPEILANGVHPAMQNGLDRLLATYCSPTLAGIKPAQVWCRATRNLYPDLPQRLKEYRDAFSAEIRQVVCACSAARFLLLVYSKPQPERIAADPQVQHVLRHFAYPVGQPLDVLLRNLKRRIPAMSEGFHTESDCSSGYPIEDVVGFIRYAGKGCKLSGLWKVNAAMPGGIPTV